MESWDAATIYKWLTDKANLPESVAHKFLEKDIDGCVLLSLQDNDLKDELDIGFAHRRKVLLALEKYREDKCMYCIYCYWCTCQDISSAMAIQLITHHFRCISAYSHYCSLDLMGNATKGREGYATWYRSIPVY